MLKIAICDDNPLFTNMIEEIIDEFYPQNHFSIDIFNDSPRFYNNLRENEYDIYFLDVEMPEITGIDLAKEIRTFDNKAFIVFLTSYSQYMKEVFKVNTFDYLLKPINHTELKNTLDRICKIIDSTFNYFTYTKGADVYRITFNDIIYFEKSGRYTILHGTTIKDKFIMKTEELMHKLDYSFIQIHKSFVINSKYIEVVKNDFVQCQLTDWYLLESIQLPLGRKYKTQAREHIFNILETKI